MESCSSLASGMLVPKVIAYGTLKDDKKCQGYIIMHKLDVTMDIYLD